MARLETWLLVYPWKYYLQASEKAVYACNRLLQELVLCKMHQMLWAGKRQKHFHHHSKDSRYSWDQNKLMSWRVQAVSTHLQSDRETSPGFLKCSPITTKDTFSEALCGVFFGITNKEFQGGIGKRMMWLFFLSERNQEFHAWMHRRASLEAKERLYSHRLTG